MIKRWDVITIGNLSRNRYWGESDERGMRKAWCTCTLIRGDGFCLLVDPSLQNPQAMIAELDRRTGLKPDDVDAVFVTHEHADHHWGISPFTEAEWWAAGDVAEAINQSTSYARPVEAQEGHLFGGVDIIHTPGHTMEHHSLLFECLGRRVVVAGDSVMTRDFFAHKQGYFNSVDFELAAQTIERIGSLADIVVPGHDNYFAVELTPFTD